MYSQIPQAQDKEMLEFFEASVKELAEYFGIDITKKSPKLFILPDRKTINMLKGKETEDWVVGWGHNGDVYVLDFDKFGVESKNKYSFPQYQALVRHEIVHCLMTEFKGKRVYNPRWLEEGIAIFLSGQLELRQRRSKDYKFSNFLSFYDHGGAEIYEESGFAVRILAERFGREKLLDLIKRSAETETEEQFAKLFEEIYGVALKYENFKM